MKQKTSALFLLSLSALLLSGCVVTSLEPWFAPSHHVSDDRLPGVWLAKDDGDETQYTITKAEKGYLILLSSKNKNSKGDFEAVLGRTNAQFFLDVRPARPKALGIESDLLYPAHTVVRVEFGPDILVLRLLKTDAAEQAVRLGQLKTIDPQRPGSILLNSTPELQRFIAIHAANLNLWDSPVQLTRVSPSPPAQPSPPASHP